MNQESAERMFLETFDEFADAIFRFCMVKTSAQGEAEDLTQETFMRYWQALREGKEMTNVRSFLYTIANHLVIDWYRKKKADSLDRKVEDGFQVIDQHTRSPEEDAAYAEALAAIRTLSPGDAEVLLLRFVEGLEPRDIAEILGESANVVSVRINRALARLGETLHV